MYKISSCTWSLLNILLAIATNITMLLMAGFVVQVHISVSAFTSIRISIDFNFRFTGNYPLSLRADEEEGHEKLPLVNKNNPVWVTETCHFIAKSSLLFSRPFFPEQLGSFTTRTVGKVHVQCGPLAVYDPVLAAHNTFTTVQTLGVGKMFYC